MASIRSLHLLAPCLRRTPVAVARARLSPARFLNTDTAPILYSAHAKVIGAREGQVESDGFNIGLTMPTALGGPGEKGKTNPEELFAAGYGACFQSAMNAAASQLGLKMPKKPEDSVLESTVHLVGDGAKVDFGIRVNMKVKVNGLSKEDVEKVVEKAKEVCPYSRATKGNVTTTVEVL